MIEVEKKFILDEQDKERITKDAEFLNERTFTDAYYDTADFVLTSQDKWLRTRDGKFELKLPLYQGVDRLADQYDELEDEASIKKALGFSDNSKLADELAKNGYEPFGTLTTTRKKYQIKPFIIDLDVIDFGNSVYTIGEIEMMVVDKSEIENAVEQIINFAKEHKLSMISVRGKVIEYIKRYNPKHYQALIDVGVIRDF